MLPAEKKAKVAAAKEVLKEKRRGSDLSAPIFKDVDVDAPDERADDLLGNAVVPRRGSITGTGKDLLEIEDALDRLGGVSWFQLVQFLSCGVFWFANPGVNFSVFANAPCRGGGTVCTSPDGGADGRGECCSAYDPASLDAGNGGCFVNATDDGVCAFAGPGPDPTGVQPFWSDCRSVSCQFDLGSETNIGVFRELFDSSFFAGWMWSVAVWGAISDKYGRRTALWLALAALHLGQYASALAPNAWVYLIARHFVGVGVGCTSLTTFVIGTEYAPRSRATAIKAGWSYFSLIGGIAQSFAAKAMYDMLPGYNWRLLTLVMSTPLLIWTVFAYFLIAESPRWMLVKRGVPAATEALARVARRNGKTAMLQTFQLRPPKDGTDDGGATPFKEEEQAQAPAGGGRVDGSRDLCCHPHLRIRVLMALVLWFSIAFSYYGLVLRAVSLPGDVFTNNALGLLVELPALAIGIFLLDAFGRKRTTLLLFLLLGAGSFTIMIWTTDFGRLFLNLAGRAVSGAGFAAVYLWSSELFPTSLRHSAMGLGSMSARIGSVIAPFAARVGDLLPLPEALAADVPLLMFGFSAVVAGLVGMVMLPETRGLTTPETVSDLVVRAAGVRTTGGCCGRKRRSWRHLAEGSG